MKVLIVSDTHGYDDNLETVLEIEGPVDAMIHCGDVEGSEDYFEALLECPVYMVRGNNDFFSNLDGELEFELAGLKIFLTHGHYYGVSMGIERILEEGLDRGADIVMFGHTHKPVLIQEANITILNPGSLTYPRQEGRKPSYFIMEIDQKNNLKFYKKMLTIKKT